MSDTIVPFIVTFVIAGAVIWVAYKAVAWWDRKAGQKWAREPLSNLDRMDGLKDDEWLP